MKHLFIIIFALVALDASAQGSADSGDNVATVESSGQQVFTFGFLSYDEALRAMPEYATAQQTFDTLKEKYDSEAKRVEGEFNKKYEEFLEGQRDFPQTILQKRQSELQELMEKNIAFKEESRKLLADARRDAFAPLHERLQTILKTIGEQEGLAFIINTDNNAVPFVNLANGKDVSSLAKVMME